MKRFPVAKKHILVILITLFLSFSLLSDVSHSQDFNQIKVQLLSGKADYEQMITVSGSNGLMLTAGENNPYSIQSKADEPIGLQFDRYHLQLIETTDIGDVIQILTMLDSLEELDLATNIEVVKKNKKVYFRVIAGGYSTIEEMQEVQDALALHLKMTGRPLGSLHWSVGTFADPEDANKTIADLREKGFDAYLAQVNNDGKWEQQVWVGQSSNQEEHLRVKHSILDQFPELKVQAVTGDSYLIIKENGFIDGKTLVTHALYVFSPSIVVNIQTPDPQSTMQIKERTSRGEVNRYRGQLNVQLYNGVLAVVNQLPLETYLYGVVGSEMYSSFPLEALKAQAVAARTFSYQKLLYPRNSIAHIYDTTADQAYYGVAKETDTIRQAVDQTTGMVIVRNGKPVNSFYSSNAGGITADGTEVWGNVIPHASVKPSPEDQAVLQDTWTWYRILRSNGQTGYIRSDFIDPIQKTHPFLQVNYGKINGDDVNFRTGPSTLYFPVITTLPKGEEIVILESVYENNAYSWVAGPFSPAWIMERVNTYQLETARPFTRPILDLKVKERGPSGRVTLLADGNQAIPVKYPDYYRTLFGGLSQGVQSGLFEIEQTGRIEVLAANGKKASIVNKKEQLYIQAAGTRERLSETNIGQETYFILNGEGNLRVATKDQKYLLHGNGLGHGIGMSQWGAKGMADAGYNYQEILLYYYQDVELKKLY